MQEEHCEIFLTCGSRVRTRAPHTLDRRICYLILYLARGELLYLVYSLSIDANKVASVAYGTTDGFSVCLAIQHLLADIPTIAQHFLQSSPLRTTAASIRKHTAQRQG